MTQEHRYRLGAAIRPLLFWVGAKNVGGARIVWRHDGEGRKGYELLLGSDPARAPRRINRWGWVREDEALWAFQGNQEGFNDKGRLSEAGLM